MTTKLTAKKKSQRADFDKEAHDVNDSLAETVGKVPSGRSRAAGGKQLVIVESPAKATTIARFLGKGYEVASSLGHVRDLPTWRLGVNIADSFRPSYVIPKEKRKIVSNLKTLGAKASKIFLATDPDREGEAIAWHVVESAQGLWSDKPIRRVVFHSITPEAVEEAFKNDRDIDMDLVNAQQARRVLDRVVGFPISKDLSQGLGIRGLSAGRVQTPALRIVVDRDQEIEAFVPIEYWTLDAEVQPQSGTSFVVRLQSSSNGQKISLTDKDSADRVMADIDASSFQVSTVTHREIKRRPAPPFITSTLQQDASRQLRMRSNTTMSVAQGLYQGVKLGVGETVGLITYMRTDSPQVVPQAINEARDFIRTRWGDTYIPRSARKYTTRSKVAQEAHEAIRPTSIARTPDALRQYLTPDQFRLYELIWKRMVASQMNDALLDSTKVVVTAAGTSGAGYEFQVTGSILKFPGYRALYIESVEGADEDDASTALPQVTKGEALSDPKLSSAQHFTSPPPRFTEAALIKVLEERGIGRPSTYADTVATIIQKRYVTREGRSLISTGQGRDVLAWLLENYTKVADLDFTSEMEKQLDVVANGEKVWNEVVAGNYELMGFPTPQPPQQTTKSCPDCDSPLIIRTGRKGPFFSCSTFPKCKYTADIGSDGEIVEAPPLPSVGNCPVCNSPLLMRTGRNGPFVGCSGFPKCKYTADVGADGQIVDPPPLVSIGDCPDCNGPLVERTGRNGRFIGCSNYPKCRYTSNVEGDGESNTEESEAKVRCAKCAQGHLVMRRGRRGVFYACSTYPNCKFTTNRKPVPCPECEGPLLSDANGQASCMRCAWEGSVPEEEPVSAV